IRNFVVRKHLQELLLGFVTLELAVELSHRVHHLLRVLSEMGRLMDQNGRGTLRGGVASDEDELLYRVVETVGGFFASGEELLYETARLLGEVRARVALFCEGLPEEHLRLRA